MSDVLIDEFIESVVYIGGDVDWHKKPEEKSGGDKPGHEFRGNQYTGYHGTRLDRAHKMLKEGIRTRADLDAAKIDDIERDWMERGVFNSPEEAEDLKKQMQDRNRSTFLAEATGPFGAQGFASNKPYDDMPDYAGAVLEVELPEERVIDDPWTHLAKRVRGNIAPEHIKRIAMVRNKHHPLEFVPVADYLAKLESKSAADVLSRALMEADEWLTEKSGTSEGAKLGWEHRDRGVQPDDSRIDVAVAALESQNAYRKASDRLVAAKLAFGTGQYKTPAEYAARKKELKDATDQEADLLAKYKEARRVLSAVPAYEKSEWSEDKHPRDESGKFGDKGGGAAAPAAGSAAPAEDLNAKGARIERRIKELLDQGQDTLSLYDKVNGMMGAYTPERSLQHEKIIDDIMQAHEHVPSERRAVISGGLTGAGKTTTLTSDVGKNSAGVNPSDYITINPDDMKAELLNRKLMPDYEGINPGEAAWMVHEESSKLAWDLHYRAVAAGKNVIWDMTMSSASGVEQRLNKLNEAGYKVKLIYVHTTVETSIKRSVERYRLGLAQNPKSARYVAHAIITNQHDPEHGTKNKKAFETVKNRASDGWFLFDNNGDAPKLISRSE